LFLSSTYDDVDVDIFLSSILPYSLRNAQSAAFSIIGQVVEYHIFCGRHCI